MPSCSVNGKYRCDALAYALRRDPADTDPFVAALQPAFDRDVAFTDAESRSEEPHQLTIRGSPLGRRRDADTQRITVQSREPGA